MNTPTRNRWRIRKDCDGWWCAYRPREDEPYAGYGDWPMAIAAVTFSANNEAAAVRAASTGDQEAEGV